MASVQCSQRLPYMINILHFFTFDVRSSFGVLILFTLTYSAERRDRITSNNFDSELLIVLICSHYSMLYFLLFFVCFNFSFRVNRMTKLATLKCIFFRMIVLCRCLLLRSDGCCYDLLPQIYLGSVATLKHEYYTAEY